MWKKLVKKAILEKNETEIREAMQSKKKLKDRKISQDNYGMKSYVSKLSIHETRNIFKYRSSMTQNVKLNYKELKGMNYKDENAMNVVNWIMKTTFYGVMVILI